MVSTHYLWYVRSHERFPSPAFSDSAGCRTGLGTRTCVVDIRPRWYHDGLARMLGCGFTHRVELSVFPGISSIDDSPSPRPSLVPKGPWR